MKKLIVLLMIMVLFLGCTGPKKQSGKINAIVTIAPQKEVVEAIGKEFVNVGVMVPPGQDPHTYEPVPSQLIELENADLYLRIGFIEFELSQMEKLEQLNPEMQVVFANKGIELIESRHHEHHEDGHGENDNHESVDPHLWLSPKNAKIIARNTFSALTDLMPEKKDYFEKNLNDYLKKLDSVDKKIAECFEKNVSGKFLVFHPSWGYFAEDYGLEQISIEDEGKEPTAQKLAETIETAKKENIKVIFVQEQKSRQVAESIAEEIGAEIVFLNPLSENYLENLSLIGEIISGNIE